MIEVSRPKPNPFKYAAMLLGAAAIAAAPLASPAIAAAQKYWDIEAYDDCLHKAQNTVDWVEPSLMQKQLCCAQSGGLWDVDLYKCVAPSADTQGSRQLPGNVQIPSDIATAPTVTKDPPRPIRVPSDIATVSTVS